MSCNCQVKGADPSTPCPSCGAEADLQVAPSLAELTALQQERIRTLMMMRRPAKSTKGSS